MDTGVFWYHECPIGQLPVELVVKILCSLRAALTDTSDTSNLNPRNILVNYHIYHLRQVCRAWRQIITTSPQLWTSHSLYNSRPWLPGLEEKKYSAAARRLPFYLKLSQNAPLDVVLNIQKERAVMAGDFAAQWQLFLAESHRWRTLTLILHGYTTLADLRTDWVFTMTKLKELRVWLPCYYQSRLVLTASNAPSLNKVTLVFTTGCEEYRVILPWSQLSHFEIRGAKKSSYAYFMTALNGSSHLKYLVFGESDRYTLDLDADRNISLPQLVELDLTGIRGPQSLLQRLHRTPLLAKTAFLATNVARSDTASTCIRRFSQFLATCHQLSSIHLEYSLLRAEDVKVDFGILFTSIPNLRNLSISLDQPYFDEANEALASADIIIALLTVKHEQLLILPNLTSIVAVNFSVTPFLLSQMIYSRSGVHPCVTKLRSVQFQSCTPYSRFDRREELWTGSEEVQSMMRDVAFLTQDHGMWADITFLTSVIDPEVSPRLESLRGKSWAKSCRGSRGDDESMVRNKRKFLKWGCLF